MSDKVIEKIKVANLDISATTKQEFLAEVDSILKSDQQAFITTPNSEFLYAALRDNSLRDLFNSADIALADGIAIFWAERFLAKPFKLKSYWGKIIEAWLQVITTGARILFTPKYLYQNIPEKLTGAEVFYDLIELAGNENKSVYFVNHRSDSAEKTARILKAKYPNLSIGVSRKNWDDNSLLEDISIAKPDMLFVSYGQPSQEKWIKNSLKDLPVSIAMGIGGTFDYAAGFKIPPPQWIRSIGLEWLFRLVTQPMRLPRIYRATWGLVMSLVKYKVFTSYDYRQNVCVVVVNSENKMLLCHNNANRTSKIGFVVDNPKNEWMMPQGGVKSDENTAQAARRELEEETNITSVEYLGQANYINQFDWPNGIRDFFKAKRKFRGQKQFTVFFRFTGQDSEVKVDPITFSGWKWVTLEDAEKMVISYRREHLRNIIKELSQFLEKAS